MLGMHTPKGSTPLVLCSILDRSAHPKLTVRAYATCHSDPDSLLFAHGILLSPSPAFPVIQSIISATVPPNSSLPALSMLWFLTALPAKGLPLCGSQFVAVHPKPNSRCTRSLTACVPLSLPLAKHCICLVCATLCWFPTDILFHSRGAPCGNHAGQSATIQPLNKF